MRFKTIGIVAHDDERAQQVLNLINDKYDVVIIKDAKGAEYVDVIVALGGDGFMLRILHDYIGFHVPVYGINCGTVGFLMNKLDEDNFLDKLEKAKTTCIHPLHMVAITRGGQRKEALAFNEVSLLRKTGQAAKIAIYIDGQCQLEELACDGVMVSTPAGSSAYNYSVGGPIIPLRTDVVAITPISPFRPRRWRGALLPSSVEVKFEILQPEKRPVNAVADYFDIKDVISVEVREDKEQYVNLLFDRGHSLEERILSEQFRT